MFYDFSKKNSALSIIHGAEQAKERLDRAIEKQLGNAKISDLRSDFKRKQDKVFGAQVVLVELHNNYKGKALGRIIAETVSIKQLRNEIEKMRKASNKSVKRTIEDSLGSDEQKLFAFVVNVIKQTYAKGTAEKLVSKIRKEMESNYINKN